MEMKGSVLSDLLLGEVLPAWSRETVTLADLSGKTLERGTVLAESGGLYAPVASGNTGKASAVLLEKKADVGAGETAVVVARGAVLGKDALIWPAEATDAEIAAGLKALAAATLPAREKL